jgi:protein traN
MATGKPVVIAFNAGNLPKVAAKMAAMLPENAPVYIAADNDASQTGIKKATEAAQVLGNRARVVMPEFTGDEIARFQQKHGQDSLPSDFNDLHELRGLDAVQSALNRPLAPEMLPETAVRHEEVREHNNAQAIAGLEPAEAQQLFEAELGKINNVKIRDSVKRELASRDVGFRLPERQKQPAPAQTATPEPSQGLNEGSDTPFTRAVDDVVSGNVSAGYIALGTTPDVLQMLGVPQGKVRISGGTIEKAMAKYIGRSHNYDQNDHWVRPGDLKQLQSQMNDPIAIFQSATNAHSLVVLTELYEYEDNKEKPMIAALHINKGKGKHGADLINVSSVYGRSDMQLVRAFDTDLLYANEKKVQDFLTTHPLQLHWDITSSSELSMRNIKTEMDLVQWQNAQKQPIQSNPQQSVPREPVRHDGLGQPEKQPAPEKSAVHSERAPWNDFPPLIRNGTLEELKNSENYQAAKAGDSKAALSLVQSLLNEQTIADIQEMAGGREPVIVAIHAEESAGRNRIPAAMAAALSVATGWQVDKKLYQADFVGRTGTDAVYRLANPPIFRGDVQAGRDYLIVDDNSTMGGTIASLRGYIENRGGHVIGAAVMSARETGLDIVPTQKQLDDIQRKHGDAPNDYWTNAFGYGIDRLTRGEAGTIRTSPSFDRLRSGIDAARLQRSIHMDGSGITQKTVDTAQSPEPKHLNRNPRTADDKPLSAVSFAQKENIMTDLSPEQIRSYAQRIANITDEADRNAAIDEFAENHGTNIRRQVGEILQERAAQSENGRAAQNNGTAYSQDNPYAQWAADDDEVRRNADDWEARKPLTETMLSEFNTKAERQGFATYIDSRHSDGGVFQADKSVENGAYRIEIEGMFKNHGGQSVYEAARDFTVSFHENGEITDYLYTNDLDAALAQSNRWLQSHEMPPEKQSEPDPTAAEQAAVSASGSPEPQAATEQVADAQPESAAETVLDEENGIEFDGETQDLSPQSRIISNDEVLENLAQARQKEMLEQAREQNMQQNAEFLQEARPIAEQQSPTLSSNDENNAIKNNTDRPSHINTLITSMAAISTGIKNLANNFSGQHRHYFDHSADKPTAVTDWNYEHPPAHLKGRYIFSGGKYLSADNQRTELFEDKGRSLTTKRSDSQIVADMLEVAQAKGWTSLKLSGSKEFKREMFLAAESKGISTKGYKPSAADLELLEKMRQNKADNGIEQATVAEPKPQQGSNIEVQEKRIVQENNPAFFSEAERIRSLSNDPQQGVSGEVVHATEQLQRAGYGKTTTVLTAQHPQTEYAKTQAAYTKKAAQLGKVGQAELHKRENVLKQTLKHFPNSTYERAMTIFMKDQMRLMDGEKLKSISDLAKPSPERQPTRQTVPDKRHDQDTDIDI